MHEYHLWMKSELAQPMLIVLHSMILDNVNEALKHLDQLIETLQPRVVLEPGLLPSQLLGDEFDQFFVYYRDVAFRLVGINQIVWQLQ